MSQTIQQLCQLPRFINCSSLYWWLGAILPQLSRLCQTGGDWRTLFKLENFLNRPQSRQCWLKWRTGVRSPGGEGSVHNVPPLIYFSSLGLFTPQNIARANVCFVQFRYIWVLVLVFVAAIILLMALGNLFTSVWVCQGAESSNKIIKNLNQMVLLLWQGPITTLDTSRVCQYVIILFWDLNSMEVVVVVSDLLVYHHQKLS